MIIDKTKIITHPHLIKDLKTMQSQGFTVREMEILTGVSKSQVSRELKE